MASAVSMAPFSHATGTEGLSVTMPDGSNVRQRVSQVIVRLQRRLLEKHEDDTKSFFHLVSVSHLERIIRACLCYLLLYKNSITIIPTLL